jgi:hypothetical protein
MRSLVARLEGLRVELERAQDQIGGQREVRGLIKAQAEGLAGARTRLGALLKQQEALAAEIAAVKAEVDDEAAQAQSSHRLLEHAGVTRRTQSLPTTVHEG